MGQGQFSVDFKANPIQDRFIRSRAKADLFSSRMGEGKSAALAWAMFYHTRHNPGAYWCMVRDTWANLQTTTMKEFFKWFPPGIAGTFHASKKEFEWAEGLGKGTVTFLGLDDPSDASKLQSRELAGIAIDEPAPAATSGGIAELVFDIGLSRLRQPNMNWYSVKLAENNPDESHWTHRRFVDPGSPGFVCWQPPAPENIKNLPDDYYNGLRQSWSHRPDLIRRFIDGKFGFQLNGQAVTPEWSDELHLSHSLNPLKGKELVLLWDFGLNPTCIITQVTPMRHWNILEAYVGEDIGVAELGEAIIRPLLASKYKGFQWRHVGDPAGTTREQSSSRTTAVRMLCKMLGGPWKSDPKLLAERVDPLRAVLGRVTGGRGLVQVDRALAAPVWHALRGGWHHHVARTGITSGEPVKDKHSHPGDAMGYGAAFLFPLNKLQVRSAGASKVEPLQTWSSNKPLGFERPGKQLPAEARQLGAR